uniref:Nuclear receptor domain-containing protein n=1 Tax=Panagrellus redivivus TaxID=6233 RepID=A0A7E4W913_PANRE
MSTTDFPSYSADLLSTYGATTDESGVETSPKSRLPGTEPCIICGADARGLHFQVVSCRACAAFFKRSLQLRKVYQCRTGYRDCDLTKTPSGKPICRFCRLNKCHAVGMRLEGTSVSPEAHAVRTPPSVVEGEIAHRVVNGNRLERDFNQTIAEIKQILSSPHAREIPGVPPGVHQSAFQQIQYAFAAFRQKVCPAEQLTPLRTYDKLICYPFMEAS